MVTRQRGSFDFDWKFKQADAELMRPFDLWLNSGGFRLGAPSFGYDDSQWQAINLPHDFIVENSFAQTDAAGGLWDAGLYANHGSRPGGVGWYRKHFTVPENDRGERFYLFFDGVFRDSQVFVNEFYIGRQASGYCSFYYDITDQINFGGDNLVVVRADATRYEGWFYEGGGIYRHVWLVKCAPLHVAPWGTFITSEIDFTGPSPEAALHVRTNLKNMSTQPAVCELTSALVDSDGITAAQITTQVNVRAWDQQETAQHMRLSTPRLWSLESPHLYTLVTTIRMEGQVVDTYETPFGVRSLRFDPNLGFFLNEQPVKIKGVCCHQDHAGVGSALPDRLHEYRLEKLKEMGCNAYRCSHHPPAPELLDACDRLGILVMDENRRMSSANEDLSDLHRILLRDRNHPSIILWSIGNEEIFVQWKPQAQQITGSLLRLIKKLDPTRPATLAICYWNPAAGGEEPFTRTPPVAADLDVMGFNYAPQHWELYHALHPDQPLLISEASTDLRTRDCYEGDAEKGTIAWGEPGTLARAEEQWDKVSRYPYLSGTFLWTGFDYRGEPSPLGWPAISSHFGIMDTCGFHKDNYFYYKASWCGEALVHIFPHWNRPGHEGQPVTVYCYSSCGEVELFLNGESLGRKTVKPNYHLEWKDIPFEPGLLEARGYRDGILVTADWVETSGKPAAILLKPDRVQIHADRQDISVINVEVVDEHGRIVPTAEDEISFTITGEGKILAVGNGNPGSHEADKGRRRRAFGGRCQVIVQSNSQPGRITLIARSPGLIQADIELESISS